MKIRSLFFLTIIAALLGTVIACEDLFKDPGKPFIPDKGGGDYYTVSFQAYDGLPAPEYQFISPDGKVTEPAIMTKTGYGFGGWYKEETFINLWNFATDLVNRDITLYAKWDSNYYTVSFEVNGGSPVPQQQHIAYGGRVIEPQDMSKEGHIFQGWYKEATFTNLWNFNSDTVTTNIVLYAKWGQPVNVQGTTLVDKLQWLASNAASYNTYILEVSSDELLNSHDLSYSGKSNISIQLIGIGGVKTIELYGTGSLFTIGGGVTLVINENIVLKGVTNNDSSLVSVNLGNLIMNNGSKISDNTAYLSYSYYSGGGVYVNYGTFTMNGGEISGNAAYSTYSGFSSYYYNSGGGVYVNYGTFTMNGGKISGNVTAGRGGGVYVNNGEAFFTMTGGEISGNNALSYANYNGEGGGVYNSGTFTMTGGEISGNSSSYLGGGVYVSGSIEKTGGIITGYSNDTINGNVVKDSNDNVLDNSGHAVYVNHSFIRRKETTAGQGDNLRYISNEPAPPTISGAWDN